MGGGSFRDPPWVLEKHKCQGPGQLGGGGGGGVG